MSNDDLVLSSNFQLTSLHSCQEGDGESAFAAVFEKIMRKTDIRGIIVNNKIINVFRKKDYMLSSTEQRRKAEASVSVGLQINGATRFTMLRYFITS